MFYDKCANKFSYFCITAYYFTKYFDKYMSFICQTNIKKIFLFLYLKGLDFKTSQHL